MLRDISINGKLKIIIVITSSVALLVACAAFVTYDLISTRQSMASDLSTLAKVIGANSTAALAFGDNDSASEVLSALSAKQPVVRARLFLPDDTVFAEYLRNAALDPALPELEQSVSGSHFEGDYLVACEPIVLDGETIGMVRIVSDLNALSHRVGQNARALAMVLLGSLLVVLVISSRLQRTISGPISHLAKTVRAVSLEKDYNIRAVKTSRDELGMLIDGFNEMLTQIQERDVELQNARDQLERRVEERTAELQQEIGERKQAEETLRESEALFRSLAESVTAAIYIYRKGKYVYLNPAAESISGYTRDELMGMEVWDIVHPDFREEMKAHAALRLEGEGVTSRSEIQILTKSGKPRWVELTANLIRFQGEPALLATAFDTTERKGWEDALRESEEKYRTILQSIQEGYYEVDLSGSLTFFNDSLSRIMGTPAEKMRGLKHRAYTDPLTAARIHEAFTEVFRTGEPLEGFQYEILTLEGARKILETSVSLRRDTNGQIVGFRGTSRDITERKQAEESLRESESRYKALFESATDSIMIFEAEGDQVGRIVAANPAAAESTGYTVEELVSLSIVDLQPPEQAEITALDRHRIVQGEHITAELLRLRRDGSTFPIEVNAGLLTLGNKRYILSFARDLTQRKQIEQEVAMLAHAVRSIQECVSITGDDHVVLFVNDAFVRTYGFERDEVIGKKLIDLVRVNTTLLDRDPLRVNASAAWEGELLNRRKDGTVLTIHLTVSPIHDNAGRTIAMAGVSQDITERKKIEKEVTMLAHAMRSINEFIVIADLDGTISFVNDAAVKGFGYEPEEAIGHNVAMLHSTRNAPEFVETILRAARAGGWEGEKLSRRKDGTEFPTYLSTSEIQDDNGRAIALVGVSQDITERKRAIEELKNAKEAAEGASRAKSEFLANMSHEIRTPMNGIIGMTELALDTDLSPEQREYLGMVKTSASSLLAVINDILDFSKIEAGKLDLDAVDFALRDSFFESMRPLAIRAHQKKLELAVEIPPDVPDALVGDHGRLRQILVNLVGNAIKFTEHGEIVVSVETKWKSEDGVWLHFSVRDTGIGIPPEKQQLIFSPFTQADGSTSRTYGGTGLGLAISTRFVGLMGGEMWVESEAGLGSTFHFTAQFSLQKDLTPANIPVNPANLWNLRVLIVDDNATNRRILEQVLTQWNMRPKAVESGEAALSVLKQAADAGKPFPLVLLDAYMPGMDGFNVAARIKETRELAGTTIMMLTSNDQRNDAARCRELGVAAFLIKPVMQSYLFDAIMTAMGAPAPAEEAAFPAASKPPDNRRQRLHILLAEDNTVNQKLAMRLLEKQGHTVVLAENGRAAIAAFEGGIFDLVLMDVQMPEVNGLEATAAIREREKLTGVHVPIIAMTAHALKGDRERCLAAGMDDYVSKPIRADELAKAIENQVGVSNVAFAEEPERTLDEVFDAAALLVRLDGDTELLRYIVELFLEELPRLMSEVRDAVMLEDSAALELAAHTLRGSVGNFHAAGVVELALRLETMGREGTLTGAKKTMAMLEREVERLRSALIALGKEQLIYEGSDR